MHMGSPNCQYQLRLYPITFRHDPITCCKKLNYAPEIAKKDSINAKQ